jgi:selenocysteine-specific elongation factor
VLESLRGDAAMPRPPAALAEMLDCTPREAEAALEELVTSGQVVRVKPSIYYEREALEGLRSRLLGLADSRGGAITLAEARDELEISRKYAQALLEYLDASHLSVRQGDRHVLRRSVRKGVARPG